MRRWFAGFLAAWILMGPVLSLSAGAAEIEQPLYSAAVPETTAETTETSTEATEHIPEDTTAATEETVNSAEAADTTVPTVETAPSIYAQQGKCRNHAAFSTLKTIKQPL